MPSPSAPSVLLLREAAPGDPYEAALRAAGFAPVSRAVLRFERVGEEALREALARPAAYSGLIVTSPRAVEALGEALAWLPGQVAAWHARAAYAVGPRTAAALEALGFRPEGAESGTGDRLAAWIEAHPPEGPLLFLTGARRNDVLPTRLREAQIPFEELVVYAAHPHPPEPSAAPAPDWLVFFSPAGLDALLDAEDDAWLQARRAAIGPTTAAALSEAGLPPEAEAAAPTPEALVAALRAAAPPQASEHPAP